MSSEGVDIQVLFRHIGGGSTGFVLQSRQPHRNPSIPDVSLHEWPIVMLTNWMFPVCSHWLWCLLALAISPVADAMDRSTRERLFVQSLEQFDSAKSREDYREAAKTLESILTDGYENGAVYYNLGNAWFRAGEYGQAIRNYRKAKPYRPRDPYLIANLEQALAAAPGRLAEPPPPWWTHVLFWTNWISYPAKVHGFFTAFSLGAMASLTAVMLRRPRLHTISIALVLAACAIGTDAFVSGPEFSGRHQAVITGETMARKGMGNSYEPAFDQPLRDGAEFQILNETADWTFGHFEGIGDGWVRSEFVAR